ncbi:MAG: hypothetical protein RIQ34_379 [Bacteroidota bacterium]|jgi:hypothetical protein
MMHVVFNESDLNLFQEVVSLDPELAGEIALIRDDYAVGPLIDVDTPEGWSARQSWWRSQLAETPYGLEQADVIDDRLTVHSIRTWLEENSADRLWIWMGQNQHDVMGYYWLMPQLKDFTGRIDVLYMNNLPFINEKGQIFYPAWLSEIPAKEFRKAKKLARPITPSEFEIDPDEFSRMKSENAMVRILEGGKKIMSQPIEFFDKEILRQCTGEFQKATRVLQHTQQRMKIRTGDVFLMARIRELLRNGQLQTSGEVDRSWKDLDLKLPGGSSNLNNTESASVEAK